jgi:hypothetical protein
MFRERVKDARFSGCLRRSRYTTRGVPLAIFLPILLALTMSCAQMPQGGNGREPMFGTWANKEYMSSYWVWKFVYQPDGRALNWHNGKPSDQPNNGEGRFTIERKWVDSEGNTWYRIAEEVCIAPYSEAKARREYALIKIRVTGNVLEGEWSTLDFPAEFGAFGSKHFVFYRQ